MWTSSPFLNNAIQGDDGGKGNINSRAELVASLSTPAKTVYKFFGVFSLFNDIITPGLAFAAAYLSLFAVARGPIPALYGSISLLILVMVVTYLPYASRSGISAMMQVGPEPEEAGMVLGAGFWRRITSILAPLQKSALIIAIILPFITGMKELSLVVMLVTPGTELLTTQSIRFLDFGYTQLANATILIIGVVVMISVLILNRVTKTNLASGLGG